MENIETKNLKEILTIAREIVTMKRDNAEWELNVLSDSERKVLQEYLISYSQRIMENQNKDIEVIDNQITQLVALIRGEYKGDITTQLAGKAAEYEKTAIKNINSIVVLTPEMKKQIENMINNSSMMSDTKDESGEYLSDAGTSKKK